MSKTIHAMCHFGHSVTTSVPDDAYYGSEVFSQIRNCSQNCGERHQNECSGKYFLRVAGKNVMVMKTW